ncbi:MAG: L-serine ammonia-lyase [Rhodobiaceae bacterium]|nr:L-serine ammonia-lyase [Rhodobiaceae bacterium]
MFLSVFDLFKIGIGPSSSHTVGPMVAARRFLDEVKREPGHPVRIAVSLHGSLAYTGVGHGTDKAVQLGLIGESAETVDLETMDEKLAAIRAAKSIEPPGHPAYVFDPDTDLVLDRQEKLPGHANGMRFSALDGDGRPVLQRIYYSVGGGFVMDSAELQDMHERGRAKEDVADVPHPFRNAKEMLAMAAQSGLSIAAMKRANEHTIHPAENLDAGVKYIWETMNACIDRGLGAYGPLPGGLGVKRRAAAIHDALKEEWQTNARPLHAVNDWLGVYAMAVNEENAAGGRVVTAPTNGAAGVVPAVIRYYRDFCIGASEEGIADFLLTAAAIGGIIKTNASISGAEVGCQGEVGSASAMAAAGLAAALGGTPEQVENAAEIALEHHLGMTCDPIAGLVQVPCIERNGLGAVKAVTAASLALRGDGSHFVPLDACIETMRQTGLDMNEKYKETSLGGLAVNVVEC